jgi:hypothetical protein
MHTYTNQYCGPENVSFQYLVGNDILINEQWREIPEWIERVTAVRPIIKLEHFHIAILAKPGYCLSTMRCRGRAYTRITMSARESSSSRRGNSWVSVRGRWGDGTKA